MSGPLTGGARRQLARRVQSAGYRLVAPPETFLVEAVAGPLRQGEAQRARAWGAALARELHQTHVDDRSNTVTVPHGTAVELDAVDRRTVAADGQRAARASVDLTRVVVTAEVVLGAVVVAGILRRRAGAPKAFVTMGPGGWVSMKGGTVAVRRASRPWGRPRRLPTPAATTGRRAPVWARVLSAVPLQALGS